jgi:hypothetical protein
MNGVPGLTIRVMFVFFFFFVILSFLSHCGCVCLCIGFRDLLGALIELLLLSAFSLLIFLTFYSEFQSVIHRIKYVNPYCLFYYSMYSFDCFNYFL